MFRGAGSENIILGDSSSIVGGIRNHIGCDTGSDLSFIGGGIENCIIATGSSIVGGGQNCIGLPGGGVTSSFIGGGTANEIVHLSAGCDTEFNFIVGGWENHISDTSYSIIGSGYRNCIGICSQFSGIFSGQDNKIILNSAVSPAHSVISGGKENLIGTDSLYNFIGGGATNCICSSTCSSGIMGGALNTIQNNSKVSAILGGVSNTITGSAYSSIIGGSGNSVSHDYAGVFGCNVASVMGCALHANTFVAQNMPDQTACLSLPSGALYYCSTTCIVYRKP